MVSDTKTFASSGVPPDYRAERLNLSLSSAEDIFGEGYGLVIALSPTLVSDLDVVVVFE
jgi:hypothetical protein